MERRYCCCFVVVDSLVMVFSAGASGLETSDLTSVLRVLLLDSVVVTGAGAAWAGVAAVAAGAAGACWQPIRVRPKAVRASAAKKVQEYSFMCVISFRGLSDRELLPMITFIVNLGGSKGYADKRYYSPQGKQCASYTMARLRPGLRPWPPVRV